ncbi:GNAT family N-acetyltransferase, partial [Enterobacter hormaechei]|nr:GNAT family N-acetyltransferase [Enterobacter hormaechei]
MPEINQHGQTVNDIVPDWKCARALTRTLLTGQYCRLEPLDADRHSADLFEAYALGDDSDWTWLASTQPVSVEATAHWGVGKGVGEDLGAFAVFDLRTEKGGGGGGYM